MTELFQLSLDAQIAVALTHSGATDDALGFLVGTIKNKYGKLNASADSIPLAIASMKTTVPQCFLPTVNSDQTALSLQSLKAKHQAKQDSILVGVGEAFKRKAETTDWLKNH